MASKTNLSKAEIEEDLKRMLGLGTGSSSNNKNNSNVNSRENKNKQPQRSPQQHQNNSRRTSSRSPSSSGESSHHSQQQRRGQYGRGALRGTRRTSPAGQGREYGSPPWQGHKVSSSPRRERWGSDSSGGGGNSTTRFNPGGFNCAELEANERRHRDFERHPVNYIVTRRERTDNDFPEECRCAPEILEQLAKDYIYPLKKRHTKFPKAMFYCRICEYHCDTVPICQRHVKDNRHQRNKSNRELEITLRSLPEPSPSHCEFITEMLQKVADEWALTDEELEKRNEVVKQLDEVVNGELPCCHLRLFGSSLSKFGIRGVDVNIDLVVSESENPPLVLMAVADILPKLPNITKLKREFSAKIPVIEFTEKDSNLKCVISLNNLACFKTSQLLANYASIDPRVRTLGTVFRRWAQLCLIDRQLMGTLPSYAYSLMLVYFLQQHTVPVLPVLHEMVKKKAGDDYCSPEDMGKQWKSENRQTIGELWLALFKFYSVGYKMNDYVISLRQQKVVTRSEKNWSSKKIAIEDPYTPKRNLARFISNQALFDYILDRFKMTYKYFGIPHTKNGPLFTKLLLAQAETNIEDSTKDESGNDGGVDNEKKGRQFMDVLDNIAKKTPPLMNNILDDSAIIMTVGDLKKYEEERRSKTGGDESRAAADNSSAAKCTTKLDKNGKNLATKQQESASTNENCSESSSPREDGDACNDDYGSDLAMQNSHDDAESELSENSPCGGEDDSEQEGCIPASLMEALDDDVEVSSLSGAEGSDPTLAPSSEDTNGDEGGTATTSNDEPAENRGETAGEEKKSECNKEKTAATKEKPPSTSSKMESPSPKTDGSSLPKSEASTPKRQKIMKLPEDIRLKIESLTKEDYVYNFYVVNFTGGKEPALFCSLCQKEGHLKQTCPDDKLPEIRALPPMRGFFLEWLTQICGNIYREHAPDERETRERQSIMFGLQDFIRCTCYEDAQLKLFGSSCNGFGFAMSDMDICLTFVRSKTGDDLPCIQIIENLCEKLKKHKDLYNVIAITTAKVPIVKFIHRRSRLEVDISLYNTLAQENTRLLSMYSEIDDRVRVLGYTIKLFAKLCDIGDASRGSLSSYAYILMLIYFLQQRQPPVIPVLQELYDKHAPAPKKIIDGWNAWFYDDTKKLPQVWQGKNKESVGSLWLGLLRFYTEEFRFSELVVSIRQFKPLTRFEKLWNSKCIAIEDPFDLNHNLGAGVSRKMNSYIMKAFIRGRELFGTPIDRVPRPYRDLPSYLFSPDMLTDGAPPNDRGCRYCGKIGHMIKDCPRKRPKERSPRDGNMANNRDGPKETKGDKGPLNQPKVIDAGGGNDMRNMNQRMQQGIGLSQITNQMLQQHVQQQHAQRSALLPTPLLPQHALAGQPRGQFWGMPHGQFMGGGNMPQPPPGMQQRSPERKGVGNRGSWTAPTSVPNVRPMTFAGPTDSREEYNSAMKRSAETMAAVNTAVPNSNKTGMAPPKQYSTNPSASRDRDQASSGKGKSNRKDSPQTQQQTCGTSATSKSPADQGRTRSSYSMSSAPLGEGAKSGLKTKEMAMKDVNALGSGGNQAAGKRSQVAATVPNPSESKRRTRSLQESSDAYTSSPPHAYLMEQHHLNQTMAGGWTRMANSSPPVHKMHQPLQLAEAPTAVHKLSSSPTVKEDADRGPTPNFLPPGLERAVAFENTHPSNMPRAPFPFAKPEGANPPAFMQTHQNAPPGFQAPPGFMNVNYRLQSSKPSDMRVGFHTMPDQQPPHMSRLPQPSPGLQSLNPSYVGNPVFLRPPPADNGMISGQEDRLSAGNSSSFSNSPYSTNGPPPFTQANVPPQYQTPFHQVAAFRQPYFQPYPPPTYPLTQFRAVGPAQSQQQPNMTPPRPHPSPAPSPQLQQQQLASNRSYADVIQNPTGFQSRPESSPSPAGHYIGNPFPSSHHHEPPPSHSDLLIGAMRPSSDNSWPNSQAAMAAALSGCDASSPGGIVFGVRGKESN